MSSRHRYAEMKYLGEVKHYHDHDIILNDVVLHICCSRTGDRMRKFVCRKETAGPSCPQGFQHCPGNGVHDDDDDGFLRRPTAMMITPNMLVVNINNDADDDYLNIKEVRLVVRRCLVTSLSQVGWVLNRPAPTVQRMDLMVLMSMLFHQRVLLYFENLPATCVCIKVAVWDWTWRGSCVWRWRGCSLWVRLKIV